jgi:O-antigen ligase
VPSSIAEVERTVVYVAGALAVLLVAGRTSAQRLVAGTLAGITGVACWALATRLFPQWLGTFDPVAGYRLSEPLGYWNGLGLLCAMGTLLAVGFAARPLPRAARALAAGSLPVLVTALDFTFSRGAWAALAFGLLAVLALERRRLRFLGTLGLLVLVTAGAGIALAHAERVRLARSTGRLVGVALVAAALGAAMLAVFTHGGPAAVAKNLYGGFTAKPNHAGSDLNGRIFELSSNNRVALWGTAWEDAARHPLLGSGAGTFEEFFYAHRANPALNVRDAHSLYLETLAELGPAGLALLVFALGIPVAAAFRARGETAAFGAYAAYLAHAGWDWDWELPAVTLAALLAAAGLLCAARSHARSRLRRPARAIALAVVLVLAAFAAVAALGNRASAQAVQAADAGDWATATTRAEQARRLAPWAPGPLRTIGQTLLAAGDFGRAAAAFRGAIARDPRNWVLWVDLAYATDGATHRAALAEARRLNPLSEEIPKT